MSVRRVADESTEHCAWWGNLLFYLFIVLCLHFFFHEHCTVICSCVVGVWVTTVVLWFFLSLFFFLPVFLTLCEQHQVLHLSISDESLQIIRVQLFFFFLPPPLKCILSFKLFIPIYLCSVACWFCLEWALWVVTQRVWEWWVGWGVGIFHLSNNPKTSDRQVMKSSLRSICGFHLN